MHSIKLHDTAGQEEFERIRRIAYKEADCFILCYSINNKASIENIKLKWLPELRNLDRRVPIVLVGEENLKKCNLNQTARSNKINFQPQKPI